MTMPAISHLHGLADAGIFMQSHPLLVELSRSLFCSYFNVSPRCRFNRLVFCISCAFRRSNLLARVFGEEGGPISPPTARMFSGASQPGGRIGIDLGIGPIATLVFRRRVDHAGNVTRS